MSTQKLRAIYRQLNDKIDTSKEAALFEIKELKADLNELQRHLSGRKKDTDIQPDDVLRSAYELAQFLRDIRKREEVLNEMQGVAADTEAEEYLLSRGAKLLTRPAGWHFQTAKERFLLHEEDPVQAAAELRKLLAAGKRLKRPKKAKAAPAAKKAEPKAPPKKAAESEKPAAPKATPKKAAAEPAKPVETKAAAKKTKTAKTAKAPAPKAEAKKTTVKKAAKQALLPQDGTPVKESAKDSAKKPKAKKTAKAAKAETAPKVAKKAPAKKSAAAKSESAPKAAKKAKASKPKVEKKPAKKAKAEKPVAPKKKKASAKK